MKLKRTVTVLMLAFCCFSCTAKAKTDAQAEATTEAAAVQTTAAVEIKDTISFTDVANGDWYYETVTDMAGKGILSGYSDGSFKPNGTLTNAELISVLVRIEGVDTTGQATQTNHWAAGALQAALDKGWYDYDENPPTGEKFDKPVQRQIAVKMVMKALSNGKQITYDYNTESAKISDFNKLSGRYYDAVLGAYSEGILTGDSSGRFNPEGYLTRAEACTIIKRAMDKYGAKISGEITEPSTEAAAWTAAVSGGISENGQLRVMDTQLCGENGQPVVLKGMSTHGLQWFAQFAAEPYIKAVGARGANVMRFAMYTAEGGYIQNSSVANTLYEGVDAALNNDMYAIIDWHILSDGSPMTYKEQAKQFFTQAANRYKDSKGVIYEICNEPNGNITWSQDVRPYAVELISTIRSIDSDAVILVGNPQWCQDLDSVVADRLNESNIMYTCHFYAGSHTQWLRDRVKNALNNGIPVFISEWGTSAADGSGGVFTEETQKWLAFMDENNLSRCNWSLCDKSETSAALKSGSNAADGISDEELSESGKLAFNDFKD